MVTVGKRIANFKLPATGDKHLTRDDFKGKKLILYFYPKDHTPGCTRESQDFRDAQARFDSAGAVVVGVSRDSVKTHENFRAKQTLPFDLISDADETLCQAFDVIREKSLYGRKYMGVERTTFLIDAKGKVARIFEKVKPAGHAAEVQQALAALG